MSIIQRLRPTSQYDLNRRMARRRRRRTAALLGMEDWRHRNLLDCIHWRDKALNRADLAADKLPVVTMFAISGFVLAVVAVVIALGA